MIPAWFEPTCFAVVALYLLLALRDPATRGLRARRYVLLAATGFLCEASCIRAYGFYSYSSAWSVDLDVVPLAVVAIWPVVILSALELARELAAGAPPLRVAAVCGLIVLADAALIEPVAVASQLWSWSEPGAFGVPPIGVLGWAMFTFFASAWFAWLDDSGATAWIVRRAELALLLLAPIAVHAALLLAWWGALRWVNQPIPARYAIAAAWLGAVALALSRLGTPPRLRTLFARFPGALVFFALLALNGTAPLIAFVLAFPVPYCLLSVRAARGDRQRVPSRLGRVLRGLVLLLLAVWVGFLAGPVPEVDTQLVGARLPRVEDLDAFVAEAEAEFSDVTPGAEATVVWADPAKRAQTPLALVYLHGFSATRQETAPLCDDLAQRLGANLYYPRLTGHGRPGAALGEATVNAWLNDAAEAYQIGQRLGERVVLIGTSTGGTLAAWLAAQAEFDPAALILISPNFAVRAPAGRALHLPWGGVLAEWLVGPERSWKAHNAEHELFWTTRYPTRVLIQLAGLLDLLAETDLAAVRAPTLLVVSPNDRVIDPDVARVRVAEIPGARPPLEVMDSSDPSQHVLAGRILAATETAARVDQLLAFLREALAAPAETKGGTTNR